MQVEQCNAANHSSACIRSPGHILLREIQAKVKEVTGMDLAESTICQISAYPELFQTENAHNCYSEGRGIACSLCE